MRHGQGYSFYCPYSKDRRPTQFIPFDSDFPFSQNMIFIIVINFFLVE